MEHTFTANIRSALKTHFKENADDIFERSQLIQYINEKTRSANRGSKARSSFANLYAIYVILEDYLSKDFHQKGDYSTYEGAVYNKLFSRQRELPFGSKLQNHALNNRMNSEFKKYFPSTEFIPILRNETNKYMDCIEEVINIPILNERFKLAVKQGYLKNILDEIVLQSKVEFNYDESDDEELED